MLRCSHVQERTAALKVQLQQQTDRLKELETLQREAEDKAQALAQVQHAHSSCTCSQTQQQARSRERSISLRILGCVHPVYMQPVARAVCVCVCHCAA